MFNLTDCIGFITKKASKEITDVFNQRLKKEDISYAKWTALFFLGEDESLSQRELADKMNTKESSVARLLDRMEKENLCQREKDLEDRRVMHIALTAKGHEKREALLPIGSQFHQDATRDISQEDLDIFKAVLEKMVDNLTNK